MAKQKNGTTRATYSVRLNPDLLRVLKHIAVDENRSVGELLEEGIKAVIKKRRTTSTYALHDNWPTSEAGNIDLNSDSYQIPQFLQKLSDE